LKSAQNLIHLSLAKESTETRKDLLRKRKNCKILKKQKRNGPIWSKSSRQRAVGKKLFFFSESMQNVRLLRILRFFADFLCEFGWITRVKKAQNQWENQQRAQKSIIRGQ
jgi:hypothetical protein